MATLTPNGDSPTITATTVEGGLYQIIEFIQAAESNPEIALTPVNRITGTIVTDTLTYSGSFDLDATAVIDGAGDLSLKGSDYLSIQAWSPGDKTGTLKSDTYTGQFIELIELCMVAQRNYAVENEEEELLNAEYNFAERRITGEFELPLERRLTDGGYIYSAKEILK